MIRRNKRYLFGSVSMLFITTIYFPYPPKQPTQSSFKERWADPSDVMVEIESGGESARVSVLCQSLQG